MHPLPDAADPRPRAILDALTTAIVVLDARLRVEYLNAAAEDLFSVSARQAQGLALTELLPVGAEVAEPVARAVAERQGYTERELALALPDQRRITVDWTVSPMLDAPGAGVLLELHPVDRLLRISREEQLLAQSKVTRALVRALAHEIKNPLGGLRGAAQLLERALPDEALKEYTEIIIGEADRLQALVDRMLGPNDVPQRGGFNIHQVLERVRHLVTAEALASIRITRDYDPSIPELVGDPDLIIQAVLNIVRNAVEALDGEGHITLRTRTRRQFTIGQVRHRLVARIDVIDDGPGIPPEIRDQLFYPMLSGRDGGTGLGLSIAQSLIHRHGGLIECDSRPGHTEFSLYLPLEPPDERTA
ncbi:MAG: nitrogen regulation protein NR(II) [Gammaproteobacteria bacterium]|nr:nitrogen regulation protein NR(II) [Gammaproteobacteria bacterium]